MSGEVDRARAARYVEARQGELGLTRDQLADRAGIDRKTVYNLLSGDRWPQAKTRGKIEAVLGWYPGDLLRVAEGGEPVAYQRPPTGRELLADFTGRRMQELGLAWADIARDGDFTTREIEEIQRYWDPRPSERRSMERALRWEPRSIDAIFDKGTAPTTVEQWRADFRERTATPATRTPEELEEPLAQLRSEIAELREEVKALKRDKAAETANPQDEQGLDVG